MGIECDIVPLFIQQGILGCCVEDTPGITCLQFISSFCVGVTTDDIFLLLL